MDSTATDGVGEEHFTEEYVTGDVGPKEYDYSYRDYGERVPEAREVEGDMGPALSAVTYEAGVSHFASEAKKKTPVISTTCAWQDLSDALALVLTQTLVTMQICLPPFRFCSR